MSSTGPSPRSDSPDVDFSVIRTAIAMGGRVIDQILNGVHYGSQEVRNLLLEESDFIMECKVCRNLFRSLPNFVAHKRVYCTDNYKEHLEKQNTVAELVSEETVLIQPEAPENSAEINEAAKTTQKSGTCTSVVDEVVERTFVGKSQDYQFYTKVAEAVEKKKANTVTSTITLDQIPSNENAVTMTISKGAGSSLISPQETSNTDSQPSLLRQILTKRKNIYETQATTKPSLKKVIENLACKKVFGRTLNTSNMPNQASQTVQARPIRSRKSSPRKSVDSYIGMKDSVQKEPEICEDNPPEDDSDNDLEEWFKDPSTTRDSNMSCINDHVQEQEWLEHCDLKKSYCKTCNKKFTSVYALKFHVKVKHSGKEGQYMCPKCGKTFVYFMALARHLRGAHKKSETYIGKLQIMLRGALGRRKSLERTADDSTQSVEANDDMDQSAKKSSNMLPYSTGWKKCDKCGKVCWKAKSYYRHYQTCRGPEKESGVENAKDGKAHKMDEIDTTVTNVENTKIMAHDSWDKEKHNGITESLASKDMPYGTRLAKASKDKNNSMKDKVSSPNNNIVPESTGKLKDKKQKNVASQMIDVSKTIPIPETVSESDSSPIRSKSGQKLVADRAEKLTISTRSHGSAEIPNVVAVVQELKSLEQVDLCSEKGMKELRKLKIDMVEYDASRMDHKESQESTGKVHVTKSSPVKTKEFARKGTVSSESVIGQTLTQQITGEDKTHREQLEAQDISLKSPRKNLHVGVDKLSVDITLQDNVDLNVSVEVSPIRMPLYSSRISVGSPSGTSVSSPPAYSISSPSRHSESSYDGSTYGGKIPLRRMSVKEMAEIVESASLVKFARERGNKARKILNKQQKPNSNSTPKRRPEKKQSVRKLEPVVQRKVNGTRLVSKVEKTTELGGDENDIHKYETRSNIGKSEGQNKPETVENISSYHYNSDTIEQNDNVSQLQYCDADSTVEHGSPQLRHEKLLLDKKEDSASDIVTNVNKSKHGLQKTKSTTKSNSRNCIDSDMGMRPKTSRQQHQTFDKQDFSIEARHLRNRKSPNDSKMVSKDQHSDVKRKRNLSESGASKSGSPIASDTSPDKVTVTKRLSRSSERPKPGSSAGTELIGVEREGAQDLPTKLINTRQLRSVDRSETQREITSKHTTVMVDNKMSPGSSCDKVAHGMNSTLCPGLREPKNNNFQQENKSKHDPTDNVEDKVKPSRKSLEIKPVPASSRLVGLIIGSSVEMGTSVHKSLRNNGKSASGESSKWLSEISHNIGERSSKLLSPEKQETSKKLNRKTSPNLVSSPVATCTLSNDDVSESEDKYTTDDSTLSETDASRLALLIKDISDIQGARDLDENSNKDEYSLKKRKVIMKRSETKLNSDRKTMLAADRILRGQADKHTSNIFELLMPDMEDKLNEENDQHINTEYSSAHNENQTQNSFNEFHSSQSEKGIEINLSVISKEDSKLDSEVSVGLKGGNRLNKINTATSDKGVAETHPHRTRLSTGTIAPLDISYLDDDSTLLDNSVFERTYPAMTKELPYSNVFKDVLSTKIVSPKISVDKMRQQSRHEPQRFSLQTGVIQCEKCHKAFWKKQSYQIHIRSPQCRDANIVIPRGKHRRINMKSNKRSLSVSPRKLNISNSDSPVRLSKNKTSSDDTCSGVKRCKLDNESKNKNENVKNISTSSDIPLCNIETVGNSSQIEGGYSANNNNETVPNASSKSAVLEISLAESSNKDRVYISAEVAGPSYVSTIRNDSDDDSEFSGFSEADICNSSLERTGIDFDAIDDSQDCAAENTDGNDTCASLANVSRVSTDESGKESAKCVDDGHSQVNVTVGEKTKSNRKYKSRKVDKMYKLRCQDQIRVDHLIDRRNHKCLECGLQFTTISNVRRHAIRHLGWKRFKCNICSVSCYNFSECKAHLTRTHSVPPDEDGFSSFITDLNKEACKRRTGKRLKTIQRKKDEETVNKCNKSTDSGPKPVGRRSKSTPPANKALNVSLDINHARKPITSRKLSSQSTGESESERSAKSTCSTSVDSPVKKSIRLAAKEDTRPSAQQMLKGITLKRSPVPYVQKTNTEVIKPTDKGTVIEGIKHEGDDSPVQKQDADSLLAQARMNLAKALK